MYSLSGFITNPKTYAQRAYGDACSDKYKVLKEERSAVLWRAVEQIIPDIRQRAEVTMVGTPLTHQRFLRRHRGSYGPAIKAGQAMFPGEV